MKKRTANNQLKCINKFNIKFDDKIIISTGLLKELHLIEESCIIVVKTKIGTEKYELYNFNQAMLFLLYVGSKIDVYKINKNIKLFVGDLEMGLIK